MKKKIQRLARDLGKAEAVLDERRRTATLATRAYCNAYWDLLDAQAALQDATTSRSMKNTNGKARS